MSVTIPFAPSTTASPPFSASVTLAGNAYTLQAVWNAYKGNWYFQLTDSNGNLIVYAALNGAPNGGTLNLVGAYVTGGSLVYYPAQSAFVTS